MDQGDEKTQNLSAGIAAVLERLKEKTSCDDWSLSGAPLRRRDCRIYFLQSDQFRLPRVVLKKFDGDHSGRNLAKHIHEKLLRFRAAATSQCTVPEPILAAPRRNALVMEHIEGRTSDSLLARGFFSNRTRAHVIRRAARWLQWFHQTSGVKRQRCRSAAYIRSLNGKLNRIKFISPELLEANQGLITWSELAIDCAKALESHSLSHAEVHQDFTPFNLFIQEQRTVGFDFGPPRVSPAFFDISRFLLYLDLYKIDPTKSDHLKEFGCSRRNFDLFIESYGMDEDFSNKDIWMKIQFMEVTRRLISLKLMQAKGRRRSFRSIEMAILRRNARIISQSLG